MRTKAEYAWLYAIFNRRYPGVSHLAMSEDDSLDTIEGAYDCALKQIEIDKLAAIDAIYEQAPTGHVTRQELNAYICRLLVMAKRDVSLRELAIRFYTP